MCGLSASLAFVLLLATSAAADPGTSPHFGMIAGHPGGAAIGRGVPVAPMQPAAGGEESLWGLVRPKPREYRTDTLTRIEDLPVIVRWPGRAGLFPDRPAAFPFPPQAGHATGVSTSVPPPAVR